MKHICQKTNTRAYLKYFKFKYIEKEGKLERAFSY